MNFQIAKIGHSFKGSMAYYLHDKRQEGEQHATTAERVAWTETRNLATDGPHTATRIMIATAESADDLKRAAGGSASGRKATAGPVFSFSLNWHPDELPGRDRDEMTRAADHALKVLKLDHLQAVIVCHQDEPHPHVHVIVNRINPENGKATPIAAPDVKALDRWANQYERERGQIVSPNRAKKYEAQEQKRQEHPDPERRRQHVRKRDAERKAERNARPTPAADLKRAANPQDRPVKVDKTPAGMLKELGDAQKARHRQEWAKLAADQKRRRTAIYDAAARHISDEQARAKEQGRPLWSKFLQHQRDERRAFEARERTLMGKVRNCIAAAKLQERHGEPSARGFLSMAFAYVGARDARAQVFTAEQERMRIGFAAEQKAPVDNKIAAIKQARAATLAKSREIMAAERTALIERQNAERAKVREAWRQLNLQRGRKPARVQREKPTMPSMKDFDRAADRLPDTNRPKMQPTRPQMVATPAPAPVPAGEIRPPTLTPQNVPRGDQAAAWAKTQAGRIEMAKHQPTPPARQQFEQKAAAPPAGPPTVKLPLSLDRKPTAAEIEAHEARRASFAASMPGNNPDREKPTQTPVPSPATPQSRADYWKNLTKPKAAEMSRDPKRDRSQNQDQDQEPKM